LSLIVIEHGLVSILRLAFIIMLIVKLIILTFGLIDCWLLIGIIKVVNWCTPLDSLICSKVLNHAHQHMQLILLSLNLLIATLGLQLGSLGLTCRYFGLAVLLWLKFVELR